MSKRKSEREAKKVAKSIAEAIGKFMTAQGIPRLKSMKANGGADVPVKQPVLRRRTATKPATSNP